MFKKNDPLVESVKKIMEENELRRRVEARLCEELGIASRKALPFEHHANYDALLEQLIAEEGSHPRSEKERLLAAKKYPHDIITRADVLKGRGVIDETDTSDTSMKQAAKPTTPDSSKSSDTSTGQAAKPTTSSSAPSTPSSSGGRGSPRPVHLAPNAAPNYGMIQQEEDRSSSDPDMAAPADPRAPKYKDEIKYKEEPKSTMPKNPPMPPRRPSNLEEKASTEQKRKIKRVMGEFKRRKLHSGSKKGPTVTDRKQAIAIALNQAGLSKKDGKDD